MAALAGAAVALSALIVASGVANGLVNPSLHAITTLRVPPPLRARHPRRRPARPGPYRSRGRAGPYRA